jgi:hypothetical protein
MGNLAFNKVEYCGELKVKHENSKNMLRKLLCKIGLHKWCSWDSHCERCGKYSKRQYDKVKEKTND